MTFLHTYPPTPPQPTPKQKKTTTTIKQIKSSNNTHTHTHTVIYWPMLLHNIERQFSSSWLTLLFLPSQVLSLGTNFREVILLKHPLCDSSGKKRHLNALSVLEKVCLLLQLELVFFWPRKKKRGEWMKECWSLFGIMCVNTGGASLR